MANAVSSDPVPAASPYAAESAKSSLKRARYLVSVNENDGPPLTPIVPRRNNDPSLQKLAVARRIRMQYPVIPSSGESSTGDPSRDQTLLSKTETGRIVRDLQKNQVGRMRQGTDISSDQVKNTESTSRRTQVVALLNEESTPSNTDALVIHREVDIVGGYGMGGTQKAATTALALPGQKVAPTGGEEASKKTTGILVKVRPISFLFILAYPGPWYLLATYVHLLSFRPACQCVFAEK
jgi:hypothetical protein